jgi:hypothetical protein
MSLPIEQPDQSTPLVAPCGWPGCDESKGQALLDVDDQPWIYLCPLHKHQFEQEVAKVMNDATKKNCKSRLKAKIRLDQLRR